MFQYIFTNKQTNISLYLKKRQRTSGRVMHVEKAIHVQVMSEKGSSVSSLPSWCLWIWHLFLLLLLLCSPFLRRTWMNLRWARLPSWGRWWRPCVRQQWMVSSPPPGAETPLLCSNRTADYNIYSLPSEWTYSAPCFTVQSTTTSLDWTGPSFWRDCLYFASTLTQTLSDSCKHFMLFRRWSSASIILVVSSAPEFTPNETHTCSFLFVSEE